MEFPGIIFDQIPRILFKKRIRRNSMKPSIGRIVHYMGWGEVDLHVAAIITDVHEDGSIGIHMFSPPKIVNRVTITHNRKMKRGNPDMDNILYSENKEPGTWHWPEVVE